MAVYTVLTNIRMMYAGYFLEVKARRGKRVTNLEEKKEQSQDIK